MLKSGASNVLYHNGSFVTECPRANFFLVKKNVLFTPANEVLKGITRNKILTLASQIMETREVDIQHDELKNADEAFISGTSIGIIPVVNINGHLISNGEIGAKTNKIAVLLQNHIKEYININKKV